MKRLIALAMVAVLGGCGDDSGPGVDSGRMDSGGSDGGGTDGGGTDSGGVDSGGMDSGGMDAGGMDAAPGDCDDVTCDTNATCDDTGGSPVCTCNMGFMGDGFTCTDINECTTMPTVCGMGTCMNMPGSYTCTCNMGYSFDGTTCTNVNECTMTPTICGVGTCMDTDGAYTCTCPMGYTFSGGTCTDIDECAATPTICGVGTCMDTDGSYTCTCPGGYEFTGGTCANIDECTRGTDTCLPVAVCTDTPGSFTCACPAGYTGDGITACTDIDECTAGTDTCSTGTGCVNTDGSFTCRCLHGRRRATPATCDPARILMFSPRDTVFPDAATALGYTVIMTTPATWAAQFDAGGFEAVVISSPSEFPQPEMEARLPGYITGGGRVIFGVWNLDASAVLRTAFGVSTVDNTTQRTLFTDPARYDLFNQQNVVPSPISVNPPPDMWGDNGDDLTLLGAGFIAGRHAAAAGANAIAVTNGNRVIVNGFVTDDFDMTNTDADAVIDITELARNELNFLMNPKVLVFHDAAPPSGVNSAGPAITRLGWTQRTAATDAAFSTAFDQGGFDLLLVDSVLNFISAANQTRISTHVTGGGRMIFGYWDLDAAPTLTTLFGLTTVSFSAARPVFRPNPPLNTNFFNFVDTLPNSIAATDVFLDDGDELTLTAMGFVAARHSAADGPNATVVIRSNNVIVNGWNSDAFRTPDGDADGTVDVRELYGNQAQFLYSTP